MPCSRPWLQRALAGAIALTAAWLGFSFGGAWWLARSLSRSSGLAVEIGDIDVTWRPFGLALDDVVVRARADAEPLATAARLVASPDPGALLRREARIARLRVVAPRIHLAREPGGHVVLRGPLPRLRSGVLRAVQLRVTGGRLIIDGTPRSRTIRVPPITGSVKLRGDAGGVPRRACADLVLGAAGALAVRYRRAGEAGRLSVVLEGRELDVRLLAPFVDGGEPRGGRLRGRVRYDGVGDGRWLRADAAVRRLRLRAGDGALGASVAVLRLTGFAADLGRRRVRIGRLHAGGAEVVVAARRLPSTWDVAIGRLSLADVRLRAAGTRGAPSIVLRALSARNLATGRPGGALLAALALPSGGRVRVRGAVDLERPSLDGRVKLDAVALEPLLRPLAGRVRVADGVASGAITVAEHPPALVGGRLAIEHLRTTVSEGAGERPLLAWRRLALEIGRVELLTRRARLGRVTLESPSLVVRREDGGVYPAHVLADVLGTALRALPAVPPGESPSEPQRPLDLDVTLTDGRILFEDALVEPHVLANVTDLQATIHQPAASRARSTEFTLAGRIDGGAPLALGGRIDGPALRLNVEMTGVPAEVLSPYVARATGYAARAGEASFFTDLHLVARELTAPSRLTVTGLRLEAVAAEDSRLAIAGLPLPRALALASGEAGRLDLELPLRADPSTPGYGLGAALPRALQEAIIDAITTPLLSAAALVREGGSETIRIPALPFSPGLATPDGPTEDLVDRLAVLLHRHRGLVATLRGQSGRQDAAALRAGAPAGGSPPEAVVAALAQARVDWVRDHLCRSQGVEPARVRDAPPVSADASAVLVLLTGAS